MCPEIGQRMVKIYSRKFSFHSVLFFTLKLKYSFFFQSLDFWNCLRAAALSHAKETHSVIAARSLWRAAALRLTLTSQPQCRRSSTSSSARTRSTSGVNSAKFGIGDPDLGRGRRDLTRTTNAAAMIRAPTDVLGSERIPSVY